ncbi:hypothetical protein P4O66_004704 [Electrophorus voltai]|uniref:Uncharacterized protein n=1 Tax=Electrophorus voltai TaxID=2609070 RepID=A0AAD8ZKZ7_9TELE|nr:hypothetical protein P4O66_004704 [Electrophorus voltai]
MLPRQRRATRVKKAARARKDFNACTKRGKVRPTARNQTSSAFDHAWPGIGRHLPPSLILISNGQRSSAGFRHPLTPEHQAVVGGARNAQPKWNFGGMWISRTAGQERAGAALLVEEPLSKAARL